MQDTTPLLVSTLPPSRAHQRSAAAVAVALFAFFAAVIPFARVPMAQTAYTIPVVSTLMFLGDCISAVLLFGQFSVLRSRALLVLAGGYLYTGLLVVPYALTFPGAFSEGGLLGANLQSAAWIFVFWHLGLPATVIAYAALRDAPAGIRLVQGSAPAAIAGAVLAAFVLALLVACVALGFGDLLPVVALDRVRLAEHSELVGAVMCVSAAAVILMAGRRRSVLDAWLLVVSFAWVLDAALTFITAERYSAAWYANRVIRIVSANVVLFVLLLESTRLYARLAAATLAERRAREGRAMSMEAVAAAIEHEVRQPLGAIVANAGAAHLCLDRPSPDLATAREAIGAIVADAERAAGILRAVRHLVGGHAGERELLDANAMIEETVALARFQLDAAAIGVQMDLAPGLPAIAADRRQFQEVLLNLVQNAVDAVREVSDHAAIVRISTSGLESGRVEICVADTGVGIAAHDLERIFEPFFTKKTGGTGMGLAICTSIVERHGGTLSVAQGEPYGSVFRMELPCG